MVKSISITSLKNNLSEYISKITFTGENFIITRRNKPVAALIALNNLPQIQENREGEGLVSLTNKWENFDEIYDDVNKKFR